MMNDQTPILYYDVTGDRRKELVQALGEILLWEPKYQGAPSFSYHIGNYIVDRNGTVMCPDCCRTVDSEPDGAGLYAHIHHFGSVHYLSSKKHVRRSGPESPAQSRKVQGYDPSGRAENAQTSN